LFTSLYEKYVPAHIYGKSKCVLIFWCWYDVLNNSCCILQLFGVLRLAIRNLAFNVFEDRGGLNVVISHLARLYVRCVLWRVA